VHCKIKKHVVHVREGFLDASLGQCKRMVNGEGGISVMHQLYNEMDQVKHVRINRVHLAGQLT
jgi:hypothetical protein